MRQEDRDFGLAIATVCTFVDSGYAAARRLARLGIDFTATINTVSVGQVFAAAWAAAASAAAELARSEFYQRVSTSARPRPRPRLSLQPTLYARRDARRRVASPAPSRRRRRTGTERSRGSAIMTAIAAVRAPAIWPRVRSLLAVLHGSIASGVSEDDAHRYQPFHPRMMRSISSSG